MICPCCGVPVEGRPDPAMVIGAIPFTRKERLLAERLAQAFGRFVDTWRLVDAVYGDDPNGGPVAADNVVSIMVHHIRPKLVPHGLAIETAGSTGGRRLIWSDERLAVPGKRVRLALDPDIHDALSRLAGAAGGTIDDVSAGIIGVEAGDLAVETIRDDEAST